MKLEEAIEWFEHLISRSWGTVTLTEEDLDAAHTLIFHAESARWRKLEEEQPKENTDCNVICERDGLRWARNEIWRQRSRGVGFYNEYVKYWRPLVFPEDDDGQ